METQNEQSNKLQKESDEIFQNKLNDLEKNLDKKLEEVEKRLKSIKKTEGEPLFNLHYEDNETNKMNEERFQIIEKKTEIIPQIKLFQESYSSKEIQSPNSSTFYNVNTLNRKSTFKISEKDCSDINSIVKNSVEKINDLLNSKEFNNSNFSKTFKRSSKT